MIDTDNNNFKMQLKPFYTLSFSIAAMLLLLYCSSCAIRSVYIPITQNTPLFDSARQLTGNAYIGSNHIELQSACNPVKHLAVAGNIDYGAGIAIYDIAVGAYGYQKKAKWRYEVFGGYGYNNNVNSLENHIDLQGKKIFYQTSSIYSKFYIQPAIGFFGAIKMYKIDYSFSLSSRVSMLYFNDFTYRETDASAASGSANPLYIVNKEYHDKFLYLLEPAITNKVGVKNFYAVLQLQAIIPYSQQIDVRNTKFSPVFIFSGGLQYNFRFKQKNK